MPQRKRPISDLQARLAAQILEYAEENELEKGYHLVEEKLAKVFGVSRSPVRRTLIHLVKAGVVTLEANRGFFLAKNASEIGTAAISMPASHEESLYSRIVEDRVKGTLGGLQTEVELIRRYGAKRGVLTRVLWRLAQEDIVARSPGVGWTFLPTIDSVEAHYDSYRLRMVIEPACLIEPTFSVDHRKLAKVREAHELVLRRPLAKLSGKEVFEINATFHEMIAAFSGNRFFLQLVQQQNRLRRLLEYTVEDAERFLESYREHLAIMDAMEAGDMEWGANLLRRHLDRARSLATGDGTIDVEGPSVAISQTKQASSGAPKPEASPKSRPASRAGRQRQRPESS